MKLKVLEKSKERLKIEVEGESHTLLNLLRENAWKSGASQSSYLIEHPYMSQPKIVVKAKNPKRVLSSAAQTIINQAKEFGKEFSRLTKR